MFQFAWAGARVLSGVSLVVWVISVATSDDHHALNFWLVVLFVFLFLTALLWGYQRGQGSDEVHHHHNYGAGSTINFSGDTVKIDQAPSPTSASPSTAHEVLYLAQLIDYDQPPGKPVGIYNQTFRHKEIRGPALIHARYTSFNGCSFQVADIAEPVESILWEVGSDADKFGVILVAHCLFEDCILEGIAFAGPKEMLDIIRAGMPLEPPDPEPRI